MTLSTPRFTFFDKEVVKDENGQVFDKLKEFEVTCSTTGRGEILLADNQGNILQIDKSFRIGAFRAYTGPVTHIQQLRQTNILVTIGVDQESEFPQLKIWVLDRVDIMNNRPLEIRTVSLTNGKDQHHVEVTTLYVHENAQAMAVGFEDGSVVFFKGDITKDRVSKPIFIHDGIEPVTGLGIQSHHKNTILFVSYPRTVEAYGFVDKGITKKFKESYGATMRCTAMSDDSSDQRFFVGRKDGVYTMSSDGVGEMAPLEGDKYQVHWYRGYLVVVGKSNINRDMDIVTIYDTVHKFIAYTGPIPHVSNILFEWGAIYVLAGDNKLYALLEKGTQTKLEILFKKNQYARAINIAKSQHYDAHGLVDIFRLYGDYLYDEKNDYDGAIEQYTKTIGKLEPSYVIRRFLDAQRIKNLTSYIEELHVKHAATEDHTTLLLNCYSKLKDEHKLDEFIQKGDGNNKVNFEVDTAIRVLRQSDYHKHALLLAERHDRHEWYMRIQLENIKDFQAALDYMRNLNFAEAEENLKKYGRILINAKPKETTEILQSLCLGKHSRTEERARPEEYIHIFVNNSEQLIEFLEAMVHSDLTPPAVVYNTLLELYLQKWASFDGKLTRDFEDQRMFIERKTMELLEQSERYDIDQALVLCQMQRFKAGILYLYQRGKLYQQILRLFMEAEDYPNVIGACKNWGHLDTHLWVMALTYFAKKEDNCRSQMEEVLKNIDEQKLLPPLLVVQTLANSSVCTLGIIKNFIVERLQTENQQIEEDEKSIRKYTEEAKQLRTKIDSLNNDAQVFQVSTCIVCSQRLQLPTIHFLCQHSYHQHCFESFAETDTECPACMNDNRAILEQLQRYEREQDADITQTFMDKLKTSRDGFNVIADYYGKGMFQKPPRANRQEEDFTRQNHPTQQAQPTRAVQQAKPPTPKRQNPFSKPSVEEPTGASSQMPTAFTAYSDTRTAATIPRTAATIPRTAATIPRTAATIASKPIATERNMPSIDISGSPSQLDVISMKPGAKSRPTAPMTTASAPSVSKPAPREPAARASPPVETASLSPPRQSAEKTHSRQRSAGRIIESGISFIKGHIRNSSDQSKSPSRPSGSEPKVHSRQNSDQKPASLSRQSSGTFIPSKTTEVKRPANAKQTSSPSRSPKVTAPNPFEEPNARGGVPVESTGNPFVDSPDNSFTEETNPFKESTNPFEESGDAVGTNPFEDEDDKNPFK